MHKFVLFLLCLVILWICALASMNPAHSASCTTSTSVVTNEKGRIVKRIKTKTCSKRR